MVTVAGVVAGVNLLAPVGRVFAPVRGPSGRLNISAAAGVVTAYNIDRSELVLTLTLFSDKVNSPGVLSATVGNGAPGGTAYFFYDSAVTHFFSVTLDSTGAQRSIYLPVKAQAVGLHTVRASADILPPPPGALANKSYTVVESNDTGVVVEPTGTEPPIPSAPNRWVFQDYNFTDVNNVDTWILPVNPSRMARSFGNVAFTDEPTTVSNGRIISWEGMPKPPTWTFEGSVLNQTDYRQMVKWGTSGRRMYVTDHYGHRYLVKVIDFSVTRVRDVQRPWNHTYKMSVSVLSGTGVLL